MRAPLAEPDFVDAQSRSGLSTQSIVETAIAIADVDGLDAVSIRRVAAVLGVRPMSLYTHIVSKDELLSLMLNELMGEAMVEQPLPADWREALAMTSRKLFRTFASHPWLLALLARRPQPGPNSARQARQLARAVASLRLPPDETWKVLSIVHDFVLGHALRVATTGSTRDLVDNLSEQDRAELPEVAALTGTEEKRRSGEVFEFGLQVVLDGIEHRFVTDRR